ncbi:MAG: hypothetical protein Q8M15_10130 [Bacteroidota bacterium]|nr:hypothetical protein [Bacteroidota bacterium]
MMESKLESIKKILLEKSSTKQLVFRNTKQVFEQLKEIMKSLTNELTNEIYKVDPSVEIKFYDKGELELHLKFSGDTLVFMMHTNVFDFDPNHYIQKTSYVKEDPMREFCGMIQIYNFLADSIKYNREGDMGFLVGRIFVNKEKHFFIEGKRPLAFLYNDFACCTINEVTLRNVIIEAMYYCLNFDLLAPPLDAINYITVEQKNLMSFSGGVPTGKHLGFRMETENEAGV